VYWNNSDEEVVICKESLRHYFHDIGFLVTCF